MTENPQNPPAPPEEGGQGKRPGPINAAPTEGEAIGYKLYDKTLKRFVGPLADSRSAAGKGFDKIKGHEYETRQV